MLSTTLPFGWKPVPALQPITFNRHRSLQVHQKPRPNGFFGSIHLRALLWTQEQRHQCRRPHLEKSWFTSLSSSSLSGLAWSHPFPYQDHFHLNTKYHLGFIETWHVPQIQGRRRIEYQIKVKGKLQVALSLSVAASEANHYNAFFHHRPLRHVPGIQSQAPHPRWIQAKCGPRWLLRGAPKHGAAWHQRGLERQGFVLSLPRIPLPTNCAREFVVLPWSR